MLVLFLRDHNWRLPPAASVTTIIVVNSFVLHLEALVADLKSIHLFDSRFSRNDRVVRNKTKTLRFTGISIDVHLGTDHVSKGIEGCGQIGICQIVWQVIDKQVCSGRTLTRSRVVSLVVVGNATTMIVVVLMLVVTVSSSSSRYLLPVKASVRMGLGCSIVVRSRVGHGVIDLCATSWSGIRGRELSHVLVNPHVCGVLVR
mmetsp:Transcript_27768/g.61167  ORF Transcript_27768/g.61167 Transcript_27768/m.61167 type:complete len:202 (-) Transcript_27768:1427-2032(-)